MFSRSGDRESSFSSAHNEDWLEPQKPKRDFKKVLLVLGLGGLSWVATYVGMLELIQANMGNLDFTTKIVVGFSVAMLMTMIIWLLDQMFAPHPFAVKLSYFIGYVFLTIISVGFGFGFYWKVLESRSEASRSAESAVSQVQASLLAGSARLDQLQGTLEQLTQISQQKAILERDSGTSCPNSRPGDGPRRRLRDDDAARFSFASNFVKGRSTQVKADMRALDADLKKIVNTDASTFDKATGTRNKFLQALSRKLELTATSFNAFRTDPQLRQIRSELSERANRSTFPTGRGNRTFSCPDGQLQSALFGVVKAIDQLPELNKPEIATVEGAQAVVEAFRRLTATGAGLLVFKLPPSADELRALQTQAVRSVSPSAAKRRAASAGGLSQGGLSQRDYIPLSIAVFVDLCLLLVSIGRPMNRLGGLVPKMREAERGPVYQILSKFDDIHRDPKVREKFEVFRHVVFDFNGDYYVAVPLDAPRNRNPDEVKNLQLEAHLLANLFASFEKEKIFARVYNPLLSRKTIQKKLWRQGSKFASSQAFRTYRFKDGAWSDIILGAVMGAARRANAERQRVAAEAGPQLDLPATASQSELEARAREIIAASVGQDTAAVKEQLQEPPFNYATVATGRNGHADASTESTRAAYGPYAGHVDGGHTNDGRGKATMAWPYQKPPSEPGEADVDLMPANSNTSTGLGGLSERLTSAADQASSNGSGDNVIPMPLPPEHSAKSNGENETGVDDVASPASLPPALTTSSGNNHEPAPLTDLLADAMTTTATPGQAATQSSDVEAVRTQTTTTATQPDMETSMNVRITQRTADFRIPIHARSNGLPIEFIRSGMRSTLSQPDETNDELMVVNQTTVDVEAPKIAANEQVKSMLETAGTSDEPDPILLLDAPHDVEFDVVTSSEPQLENPHPEDDLVEISRRFAPKA